MKHLLVSLFLIICLIGFIGTFQVKAENSTEKQEDKVHFHTSFYDAFLVLLNPYASKAIKEKFPDRSYGLWNAEILEVKRLTSGADQYHFNVKVKYDTYTGPHNPPEGPVIITFDVMLDGVSIKEMYER
ncbi:DUF3888 domain-containing protein [Bacillus sp. DX1.1]|uniref:DUF3888 domain-containing protein n=1 Tax=unclassified Bacillus (in: firmicutes) TaxID=185979 RepID=UPI00256FFFC0|nr:MULTISPECIES: DUF3888 domain-containing protein [unclassified Bacillus (in: firmicutes)]MDM5155286.1 DUF3888 domain-containing protein [Bacillus sp. DX1.1]WJE79605.1 DUF3888 domain-containing protein [Bacillus sp. DX3.1]